MIETEKKPDKSEHQYALDIISGTLERTIARQTKIIIVLVLVIALMATLFVWYLNQYDFLAFDVKQDGNGLNIIGDRNGVRSFYGAVGDSENENAQGNEEPGNGGA